MAQIEKKEREIKVEELRYVQCRKFTFEKSDGTGYFACLKANINGKKWNVGLKKTSESIEDIPDGIYYFETTIVEDSKSSFYPKIYIDFTGHYFTSNELSDDQKEKIIREMK